MLAYDGMLLNPKKDTMNTRKCTSRIFVPIAMLAIAAFIPQANASAHAMAPEMGRPFLVREAASGSALRFEIETVEGGILSTSVESEPGGRSQADVAGEPAGSMSFIVEGPADGSPSFVIKGEAASSPYMIFLGGAEGIPHLVVETSCQGEVVAKFLQDWSGLFVNLRASLMSVYRV